ncbi:translation initiation factor IF-2-like [Canis lupus familiaris]|uniref:translation initiation factor IF-2-like n=1 Tax=Canis lupus familiaris TaxID=9615 RepID=UPI0018F7D5AC|nr:translation initiation factor IF-2-like [Canis lupus familiaris]
MSFGVPLCFCFWSRRLQGLLFRDFWNRKRFSESPSRPPKVSTLDSFFPSRRLPEEGLLGSRLVCVDKVPSSSTGRRGFWSRGHILPRGPPPMSLADQEALDPLPLIFSQTKTVSGSWTRREGVCAAPRRGPGRYRGTGPRRAARASAGLRHCPATEEREEVGLYVEAAPQVPGSRRSGCHGKAAGRASCRRRHRPARLPPGAGGAGALLEPEPEPEPDVERAGRRGGLEPDASAASPQPGAAGEPRLGRGASRRGGAGAPGWGSGARRGGPGPGCARGTLERPWRPARAGRSGAQCSGPESVGVTRLRRPSWARAAAPPPARPPSPCRGDPLFAAPGEGGADAPSPLAPPCPAVSRETRPGGPLLPPTQLVPPVRAPGEWS